MRGGTCKPEPRSRASSGDWCWSPSRWRCSSAPAPACGWRRSATARRSATSCSPSLTSSRPRAPERSPARDREAVFAAISAIDELAGIEHVEVRDLDGGVIEESGLGVRLLGDLVLEEGRPVSFLDVVTSRTVQVRVDVVRGGAPVGRLSVIARTDDLWSRLLGVLGTGAAAALRRRRAGARHRHAAPARAHPAAGLARRRHDPRARGGTTTP